MTPSAPLSRFILPVVFGLLVLLGLSACGDDEGPSVVDFQIFHHATPDGQGVIPPRAGSGFRSFVSDVGFQVTLTQAYLTVSAVELLPLGAPRRTLPGFSGLEWLAPSALAHTGGTSTRMGEPSVIDLLAPDAVGRAIGSLEPPHGFYTALRVTLAPADDDAAYLPADFNLVGHTIRLVGTMVQPPDTLGFGYVFDLTDSLEIAFPAEEGGPRSFGHGRTVSVGIATIYDTWFDGVDPRTMTAVARQARIVSNVKSSFGIHAADGSHNHAAGRETPTAP